MVSLRKRGAVYGVIGLMLCVAVYLNWSYFQTPEEMTVANQAAKETGSVYGEVTAVDKETADAAGTGTDTDSSTAADADGTDYFAQARLSRQTARDEALSMLKETVASEDAAEGAKQDASDQITSIAGDMVKEERIESQIKAKGYTDAVVYITTETISVVVSSPENGLQASDAAAISDIIVSETGADPSMIRISEAK
ncbi:MAG: SpoIIIAH-like family protein [Eubacteriales bacterium]|nr:SpoIIIAH-like family protein [Eubacteriales bacterium]